MKEKGILYYLKYGIGEILLVVVGILIAVAINNWNEGNKQEKELLNIFGTIKTDLKNDVQEIEEILKFYADVKKFFQLGISDSLRRKDYLENPRISMLTIGYPEISFDTRGYNLIRNFKSNGNSEMDTLLADIVEFYTERMLEIKVDDAMRADDFKANFSFYKNHCDWWPELIYNKKINSFVEYALQDKDYKNKLATTYFVTYDIFLPELQLFKEQAEQLIMEIEKRN